MNNSTICIVGLGYVGLPLAHAFAKAGKTVIGFDVDKSRIEELKNGKDRTNEISEKELQSVSLAFSADPACIREAKIIIMAIPTPLTKEKKPDLSLLENATRTVGENMQKDTTIVYESTVYPGVTEDVCGPLLKQSSGYDRSNFKLAYSPERINPGDREHTITKITKVVAGEDEATCEEVAILYGTIIKAGIHKAPNIKVAEMAKAIENAQRDLNIAYINEIAMACGKIGISTTDVLAAAQTKWNFLPFTPGLVGGHCIGVDPYYLLEKVKSLGLEMPIVTAARSTNDSMPAYVARTIVNGVKGKSVLVLGLTFKENVPDDRNSKSYEVVELLKQQNCTVTAHDPYIEPNVSMQGKYDAIVLLVPHKEYKVMQPADFAKMANDNCLFFDLKSIFDKHAIENAGMTYRAL